MSDYGYRLSSVEQMRIGSHCIVGHEPDMVNSNSYFINTLATRTYADLLLQIVNGAEENSQLLVKFSYARADT